MVSTNVRRLDQHVSGSQELQKHADRVAALTNDDPSAYCKQHPEAGCCKQILPVLDECAPYFGKDTSPQKLCPSDCAAKLRALAKSLPSSGEKDGVCASAIQGIAVVGLFCAHGTDGGFCLEEVGTVGSLLNESHPAPAKVGESVEALCGPTGTTGGSCFQQLSRGQEEIYGLMEELLTIDNPWGDTDDQYPFDDDLASMGDDNDDFPENPLRLARPTIRGLNLFCNRVETPPLSPKQPYCIVHLIENTTVFHSDDDAPPVPSHIVEELADPCARSFFSTVSGTDPVAVGLSAYGNGKNADDNLQCGILTGFGEVATNLTDFCASDEGGKSTVFNVLLPDGQQPTCDPACAGAVAATMNSLGCCGQEALFESWYLGAVPAGSIPSQVRPPMDGWIYRIATTCMLDAGLFHHTCGFDTPGTVASADVVLGNVKPGLGSLNATEREQLMLRLTVHVERTVGAPAGACKATAAREEPTSGSDSAGVSIPITCQFEDDGAARAAESLLLNSPPTARAVCKYLERRGEKALRKAD